jgi:uracil-DNA glycosylase
VPGRTRHPGAEQFLPATSTLSALAEAARSCRGCDLYADATQTVFGRGRSRAAVMLVGEQPGDVEDVEGVAFVGPAGRMLDRALDDAAIDRDKLYVTNAVKHFHFTQRGKRRLHQTPQAGHVSACRPWLRAEVEAVRPGLIVCLGATAAKAVLGNEIRVLRDRGAILERDSLVGPGAFLVTVHPSSILRAPPADRDESLAAFVADLKVAAAYLTA